MSVERAGFSNLVQEVVAQPGIELLGEDEATAVLMRVANLHVNDQSAVYWWADPKNVCEVSEYSDSSSGFARLELLLRSFPGELVYLVITDDEPAPWAVMQVRKDALLGILGNLPFVEFFVASIDAIHVVFDTHENRLVYSVSGVA